VLRVEGKLESPTVFMFLKAESEAYPLYRIENRADETLIIAQKGTRPLVCSSQRTFGCVASHPHRPDPGAGDRMEDKWETIPPHSAVPFAWDEPSAEDKKYETLIRSLLALALAPDG
jgi:hypothetical protein